MTAIGLSGPAKRVVTASAFANLSDGIRLTALPLLAAATTQNAALVAGVFAVGQLPWLVLGIWSGGLVDRSDRRQIAQRTAAVRTTLLVALAFIVLIDAASIWLVLIASFVLGVGEVLGDTANSTLIPLLVASDDLERANSRMVAAEITGNELIGPALGGVLFAIGASVPFFTNAGLLAGALFVLAGLPLLPRSPLSEATTESPRAREGLRLIRHNPLLRTLTWSSSVLAAVDAAWFALLVLFVSNELGLGASGFGLLLSAGAIGGLAGAWLADRPRTLSLAQTLVAVFGLMAMSLVALSLSPTVLMTAFVLVITSGAFAFWNVLVVSARQRATPPDLYGRVAAAYRTVVVGAAIVGAATGGVIATVASIQRALIVGALILILVSVPLAVAVSRDIQR